MHARMHTRARTHAHTHTLLTHMHINNNEIFVKHKFYLQPKNRAGPRVQNSDLNYTHVETLQVKNDNNNGQKQTIRSQTAKPVSHTCMYLQLILVKNNNNNNGQKQTIRSQTAKPVSHTCMYLQLILFQLYIYIQLKVKQFKNKSTHANTHIYISRDRERSWQTGRNLQMTGRTDFILWKVIRC